MGRTKPREKMSENVLLAYFSEISQTKKLSTLWEIFSMLKSTNDVTENVKIGIFTKVISFLKKRLPEQKDRSFHGSRNKRVLGEGSRRPYLVLKVIFSHIHTLFSKQLI